MKAYIVKVFLFLLVVSISLFMMLPILFTVIGSFSSYWGPESFSAGWTLKWYRQALEDYGQTIVFTLVIAVSVAVINIFIGSMTAYVFSRSESKVFHLMEEIFSLPIAVPGTAVALALIQTHSFMRTSGWLIFAGHIIVTFPLMFRTVLGSLRSKSYKALVECASSLGAGTFYTFFHVILPGIKSTILSGSIMVFLLSLGEFNMSFFLYTPMQMTMPIGLYDSYATLRIEVGSAFTVLYMAFACPLMVILHKLNQSGALTRNGGV